MLTSPEQKLERLLQRIVQVYKRTKTPIDLTKFISKAIKINPNTHPDKLAAMLKGTLTAHAIPPQEIRSAIKRPPINRPKTYKPHGWNHSNTPLFNTGGKTRARLHSRGQGR